MRPETTGRAVRKLARTLAIGDWQEALGLIEQGTTFRSLRTVDYHPLAAAIRGARMAITGRQPGALLDERRAERRLPFLSVPDGAARAIVALISKGIPINLDGPADQQPLVLAIRSGFPELAGLLVLAGAEASPRNARAEAQPLVLALARGMAQVAMMLLDAGADANPPIATKHQPLLWAIRNHRNLARGAPPNVGNRLTQLGPGATSPRFAAIVEDYVPTFPALLPSRKLRRFSSGREARRIPTHESAWTGGTAEAQCVHELLLRGAKPNPPGLPWDSRPLQQAVLAKQPLIALELLRWGADVGRDESPPYQILAKAAQLGQTTVALEGVRLGCLDGTTGERIGAVRKWFADVENRLNATGWLHDELLFSPPGRLAPPCPSPAAWTGEEPRGYEKSLFQRYGGHGYQETHGRWGANTGGSGRFKSGGDS